MPVLKEVEITYENFKSYCSQKYKDELTEYSCSERDINFILDDSKQIVLNWINSGNLKCVSDNDIEIIKEAIYKLAYKSAIYFQNQEEDNYKENQRIAFKFLKNNGLISY